MRKKQERIIEREYGSVEFYFMERFNIAPTQMAQIILSRDGRLECVQMKWGWTTRARLIANARSETSRTFMSATNPFSVANPLEKAILRAIRTATISL